MGKSKRPTKFKAGKFKVRPLRPPIEPPPEEGAPAPTPRRPTKFKRGRFKTVPRTAPPVPAGETPAERITRLTRAGTLKGARYRQVRKGHRRVGHKIEPEGFGKRGSVIASQAVTSTWVTEIFLVDTDVGPEVEIEFLDGVRCHYPGTTEKHYADLMRAASKGKKVWETFYRLPYFVV